MARNGHHAVRTKTNQNRIRSESDRLLLAVCFCWHGDGRATPLIPNVPPGAWIGVLITLFCSFTWILSGDPSQEIDMVNTYWALLRFA